MQVRRMVITSKRSRVPRGLLLLCVCAGSCIASGCSTPLRTVGPEISPDKLSDAAFIHYLAVTPVVTVDEGSRGVLLVISEESASSDHAVRRDTLVQLGLIREAWELVADSVLDRGTFAYLLCRGLDVGRSFNEWLAQQTGIGERRAALATAVYEGLLLYGPAHDPISGGEVADALVRAEQWLAERRSDPGTTP